MPLVHLSEDILIRFVAFLDVPDIVALRKTCTHLAALTRLRSVWLQAYVSSVKAVGLPCDDDDDDDGDVALSLSAADLEHRARRAGRLARAWRSVSSTSASSPSTSTSTSTGPSPRTIKRFVAGPSNALLDARFILKERGEWLVTFVQGIWPEVRCWDHAGREPREVGRWACKAGARMVSNGVVVNKGVRRTRTGVDLAVSVIVPGDRIELVLLSIDDDEQSEEEDDRGRVTFSEVQTSLTELRPVYLNGDTLVLTDDRSETRILNWRSGHYAVLRNVIGREGAGGEGEEGEGHILFDSCKEVHFAHASNSILVARSRSVDLYPAVELRSPDEEPIEVYPLRTCTFGWIDGIAVAPLASDIGRTHAPNTPLAILVRAEAGDPWESNIHYVQEYILYPNDLAAPFSVPDANASPYIFPLSPQTRIPSTRGFLRCPSLALGRAGTALWIHSGRQAPRQPGAPSGAYMRKEVLCAAVFPGPLNNKSGLGGDLGHEFDAGCGDEEDVGLGRIGDGGGGVKTVQLHAKSGASWISLDYVESRGCVALGAVDGSVTVLYI